MASPILEQFRCMPSDFIPSFHMNNARLFRYGELTRWRITSQSGLMPYKWRYPIVEQSCRYYKEITPFQKFVVATEIKILDDKWIIYNHRFLQYQDDFKIDGTSSSCAVAESVLLAEIKVRSVIKEASGKTVRLLETNAMNDFAKLTMSVCYSTKGSS